MSGKAVKNDAKMRETRWAAAA